MLIFATPTLAVDKIQILTEQLPPFNHNEDGRITGISTTIVEAAFKRAGLDYTIKVMPWKRAVQQTDDTPNTFIYTMARTQNRENKYIWVGKLFDRKVTLFRHRDRIELDELSQESLHSQTKPCAMKGDASYELLLQRGFLEYNIINSPTTHENICPKMVGEGRADFTVYNPYALAYMVETGKLDDIFVAHSVLINEDGYYLAANPDSDPKIIKKLQQAFKELAAEGLNDKIAAEYLGY